jgi:hypothetical protein
MRVSVRVQVSLEGYNFGLIHLSVHYVCHKRAKVTLTLMKSESWRLGLRDFSGGRRISSGADYATSSSAYWSSSTVGSSTWELGRGDSEPNWSAPAAPTSLSGRS